MFDNQKIESQQLFQIKIFRNITFDFLLKIGDSSTNDSKPVSMTSKERHFWGDFWPIFCLMIIRDFNNSKILETSLGSKYGAIVQN